MEYFIFVNILYAFPTTEPYTWQELHTQANQPFYFASLVRDYYNNFPCEECRLHFKKMVDEMEQYLPLDKIKTKKEAQIYSWLVHNNVNLRLGNE